MPLYMYQAAYTAELLAAQLKNPQNRADIVGRAACEAVGGSSLPVGTASAITISSSSPMCRIMKAWLLSRWQLHLAARSSPPKRPC